MAQLIPTVFAAFKSVGTMFAAGSTAAGGLMADSLPPGGSGSAVGVNQMAGDLGYLIAPIACLWLADSAGYGAAYLLLDMFLRRTGAEPALAGRVRLLEIGDVDLQPCGGTHVRSTGEIGAVRVAKIENKGKQNRRIRLALL